MPDSGIVVGGWAYLDKLYWCFCTGTPLQRQDKCKGVGKHPANISLLDTFYDIAFSTEKFEILCGACSNWG